MPYKAPCLNQELLFDIGKKIVEDGIQEDVFKFALSGKEPLQAMKKVFSSMTTLKLHTSYYIAGWGNKVCTFEFDREKPHLKVLMYQIGSYVRELHIDCIVPVYQPIIDKIAARKQMTSFSVGTNCRREFLDQFLPQFSSTLKRVCIPSHKMSTIFRDTLDLESLKVLHCCRYDLMQFCCKTETLEIGDFKNPDIFVSFFSSYMISPHFPSIKHLIVNKTDSWLDIDELHGVMGHFSSIQTLKYKLSIVHSYYFCRSFKFFITKNINRFIIFAKKSTKLPSKVIISFDVLSFIGLQDHPTSGTFRAICRGFEFDESCTEYFCFRKTIKSSVNTESTILELQFHH